MTDYEKLYKEACGVIEELLLNDKISIKDIPQSLRVTEEGYGFYVYAFRVSHNIALVERYIEDLKLLYKDIPILRGNETRKYLFEYMFVDNVWIDGHLETEEAKKKLEEYRNSLPEEFLQGLSEVNRYRWEDWKTNFEIRRIED